MHCEIIDIYLGQTEGKNNIDSDLEKKINASLKDNPDLKFIHTQTYDYYEHHHLLVFMFYEEVERG